MQPKVRNYPFIKNHLKNKVGFSLLLFLIFSFKIVSSQTIVGSATYISDGDTFWFISTEGTKYKIRIAEIDCPERLQPYGLEAKEFVMNEILNREIVIIIQTTDRYGRKVARILYNKKDLSEELIKNGLAWHYVKYSDDKKLARLQNTARQKKMGVWSSVDPVPPWEFRKSRKKPARANKI